MSEGTELGTAAIPLRSQPQVLRVAYSSARGHGVYICMLQRKQSNTHIASRSKETLKLKVAQSSSLKDEFNLLCRVV